MAFKKNFAAFVCQGDTIECEVGGFTCKATLYRDDDTTPPDKRQDGFWPSLDPKSDGYIGPKSKRTLAREQAKMQRVMDAWKNDEWHYFGVAVTIWKDDVQLTGDYAHAIWGIEGNWPGGRKGSNPNTYFRDVANEELPGALAAAKAKIAELAA